MSKGELEIKPLPPRGEENSKSFTIRISKESFEKIEVLVKDTGRSRNSLVGLLIDYSLQNYRIVTDD